MNRHRRLGAGACLAVFLLVPAVSPGQAPPAPPIDCDAAPTDAERSTCEQRELATTKAAHLRIYEACKKLLPESLQSELIAQERGWRETLEGECTEPGCLAAAIRSRNAAITQAFPQCGSGPREPSFAPGKTPHAKTGMLPARWTPRDGEPQDVPFSFESASATKGTMSTTLGKGGELFHGSYVRVEKSTEGHLVTAIYNGFSGTEWQMWEHEPDGDWTETGVSYDAFARFYNGKVVATLQGDRGSSIRCQITLKQPNSGLSGGGSGSCQVSNGGSISLAF